MEIAVRIEPVAAIGPDQTTPDVDYRWDADTTILCATVRDRAMRSPRRGAVAEGAPAGTHGPPLSSSADPGAVGVSTAADAGMSGSVEVEGRDGSWLVLDVVAGSVRSVEVAVWPDVRHRSSLRVPADVEQARVVLPGRRRAAAAGAESLAAAGGYPGRGRDAAGGGNGAPTAAADDVIDSLEVNTAILAESDDSERTIHFILGPTRPSRHVRVARDLLFDVDERNRLAGLWLLNVPPCPSDP